MNLFREIQNKRKIFFTVNVIRLLLLRNPNASAYGSGPGGNINKNFVITICRCKLEFDHRFYSSFRIVLNDWMIKCILCLTTHLDIVHSNEDVSFADEGLPIHRLLWHLQPINRLLWHVQPINRLLWYLQPINRSLWHLTSVLRSHQNGRRPIYSNRTTCIVCCWKLILRWMIPYKELYHYGRSYVQTSSQQRRFISAYCMLKKEGIQ